MANSQHRPGANVSLSPAAYAKEKLKKVDNLETQLSHLPAKKADDQASRLRMRLCEVLSDIILTDPLFSLKHDCIGRLWRSCFYSPIGTLRSRISREKRKKGPNVAKLEKSLNHFLSEAITLYDYLMGQYHSKLLQADPTGMSLTPSQSQQSQSQQSLADSQPTASQDPAGVVPGLFRMYIHVGDLYRYQSNYGQAQTFYGKASKLAPGSGNPYNQLAVVAQLKDTAAPLNTVALYWYARSLLTTHEPFEISKANLARLFQSNRDWFHKQPRPPNDVLKPANATDGNHHHGGRDMAKAQRTVASRHFLSQFVDLHYSFFQGIHTSSNKNNSGPAKNDKNDQDNPSLSDDDVVRQMEAILGPFAVLLRASAFGDALLCKMVAICAFSEAYHDNSTKDEDDDVLQKVTPWLARTFTLALGACLAERAAVGLTKIKDQPEKMGNPGKAPPSIRLMLPLLLVCEYIETSPMLDGPPKHNAKLSSRAQAFCEKTQDSFWQNVAEVMNILTSLRGPLNLGSGDWRKASLKEFSNLIGYSPFQPFLNDSMESSRQNGFASIEEAVNVLELRSTSTQDSSTSMTQQSSTQDSVSGGAPSPEEYKIKVARFLAFGDRMADDDDTATDVGRRFERTPDGSYAWREEPMEDDAMETDDNDNPMMDTENVEDNDTQPPATRKDGGGSEGDVLVYSAPKGGGPALLVPGMLLQNRAMAPPVPAAAPKIPAPPQAQPPGLPPPPGFGSVGFTTAPPVGGVPATLPPSYGVHMGGGLPSAMPPGLGGGGQGLPAGFHHPPQVAPGGYQPATVGNSLHVFGGQEALKTGNPFAAASMTALVPSHGMAYTGMGMSAGGLANGGNGPTLFPSGGSGSSESALLGSGFLDGLFDDGSSKTTKNPFAT